MTSNHQISVRRDTYDKLKAASDLTREPVATIVTRLINAFLDEAEETKRRTDDYQGEF